MAKPLRIVHLNATVAGGAFIAAERISNALNLIDGIESTHLVFEGLKPLQSNSVVIKQSWLARKHAFLLHAIEKLDFLRFEKNKSIRFAFSHAPIGLDLTDLEIIQKADIVHLHWVNKGFLSLSSIAKLISLKKVVWTCHDMWPFTGGCYHPRGCENYKSQCGNCHYLKNPSENDLSNRVFLKKKSIWGDGQIMFITPSEWLKSRAKDSGLLSNQVQIAVIPNGIDTQFFVPHSKELKNYVLGFSAANLNNPKKGFLEFLKVCKEISNKVPRLQIKVAGQGEFEIPEEFKQLDIDFIGYLKTPTEVRDFYQQIDFYVTTSHEENLPTTIMESLSCGIPVAAFAVGGIPEMIQSGHNGIVVDFMDIDGLASQLLDYFHLDSSNKMEYSMNCRNWAIEHYDGSIIANKYSSIYKSM